MDSKEGEKLSFKELQKLHEILADHVGEMLALQIELEVKLNDQPIEENFHKLATIDALLKVVNERLVLIEK